MELLQLSFIQFFTVAGVPGAPGESVMGLGQPAAGPEAVATPGQPLSVVVIPAMEAPRKPKDAAGINAPLGDIRVVTSCINKLEPSS